MHSLPAHLAHSGKAVAGKSYDTIIIMVLNICTNLKIVLGRIFFLIRADIKSFYSSILHHKLLKDLEKVYDDPDLLKYSNKSLQTPLKHNIF